MGFLGGLFEKKDKEYYKLSAAYKFTKRDINGALKDINKAIEMDPNDAECYYKRSNLYKALHNMAVRDMVSKKISIDDLPDYLRLSIDDMKHSAKLGGEKAKEYLKLQK